MADGSYKAPTVSTDCLHSRDLLVLFIDFPDVSKKIVFEYRSICLGVPEIQTVLRMFLHL